MIYQVNGYNIKPTYFDETTNPNARAEAESLLIQRQQDVLSAESVRFSVCATFVKGNDTVWREVQETDAEDTLCKVFDTFTGQYIDCANKTEAYLLNEQKKQEFLNTLGLTDVIVLEEMPTLETQPKSIGTQDL